MKTIVYLCFIILFLSTQFAFSQWTQLGGDIDGEAPSDYSGRSVSLSGDGNRIAVGAPNNTGNGLDSGHVRVYEYNGAAWDQLGADIDGEGVGDESGFSVSLNSDGTVLAIGSWQGDDNGYHAGHVRIYEYDGVGWNQLGDDLDGEVADGHFGRSISLSNDGNTIAIGAFNNNDNGNNSGHVQIFSYDGVAWNQLGINIAGEGASNWSGWSVSLSGDGSRVAIGAILNADNGAGSGHVRIYEYNGVAWNQLGTDIDGEAADDNSGWSVSLSDDGSTVAIGAPYNDDNGADSGHVRMYAYSGADWTQLGPDIDGEAPDDRFGYSVSLSGDGNRVAIGATLNDGNGSGSGHVRIYDYNGITWTQSGTDINGEGADNWSGYSVSLSSDSRRVAVGAPLNNDNGANAGHARVFADAVLSNPLTDSPILMLKLYPNPAADEFYIDMPAGTALNKVTVYNLRGEQLAVAKTTTIPVRHLAEGVYFVEVQFSGKQKIIKKIIVSGE